MIDQGVNAGNLGIIVLILIAQLVFFITTLSIDYIRSWILLHMNARPAIDLQREEIIPDKLYHPLK